MNEDLQIILDNYTREQFINCVKHNGCIYGDEDTVFDCPEDLDLPEKYSNDSNCQARNCAECWIDAVCDIKFKGE